MLTKRIIACLDVDGGRVVKGVQFTSLRDAGDPAELALSHARAGADEIVLLDISATYEHRSTLLDVVRRTARQLFIPFTVGGGIRSLDDAAAVFDAGADKVTVNSAALADPALITRIAPPLWLSGRDSSPSMRCASATAMEDSFGVKATEAGTPPGAMPWNGLRRPKSDGAGEIIADLDRPGRNPRRLRLRTDSAVVSAVNIPVIASGGAGSGGALRRSFSGRSRRCRAGRIHFSSGNDSDRRAETATCSAREFQ